MEAQEYEYRKFVHSKLKNPEEILETQSEVTMNLIHAAMLISGEAGELLDAVKKHVIYDKPLDIPHVIEELGDLEFGMEFLRQIVGVSRQQVLEVNKKKLNERYKKGFTKEEAINRDSAKEREILEAGSTGL